MDKLNYNLNHFRKYREGKLKSFDLWEKAVLRGREPDSIEVMKWYFDMLNFPEQISETTTINDYPVVPFQIKKYI